MERTKLIDKAYNRGSLLSLNNKKYVQKLEVFFSEMLKEDLNAKGDITTNSILNKNYEVKAKIRAKQNGILAGVEEITYFFNKNKIKIIKSKKDGSEVKKDDTVFALSGNLRCIIKTERIALNLLQRMSGIASLTNILVNKNKKIKIAATRKTVLGLIDNKAVFLGKGLTHRLGLFESILIKENHLECLKKEGFEDYIGEAIKRAWKSKDKAIFVEIETQNKYEAIKAAQKFKQLNKNNEKPCIIMLDNFLLKDIKAVIKELKKLRLYDSVLLEASGGINPTNIEKYDKSGADVVSLGCLTHSAKSLDMSLIVE